MARDHLAGSIIGTAVGDALGMPLEFVRRESIGPEPVAAYRAGGEFGGPCPRLRAGQWTDDTQMMLAVLESLLNCHKADLADIRERFYAWANGGDHRFPGNTCMAASLARKGQRSEGCGSIMRTLPLGFLVEEKDAIEIGRLTHVAETCDRWVGFLHRAVREGRPCAQEFYKSERMRWNGGNGAWVVDTGMCALKAVLETGSFEDAVVAAVNMGGDTDSIGAVAGGLAGAWYGFSNIPEKYLFTLERGAYLRHLADMLYETFSERFME
jgi:ADP-ribosyl-[dinitrogen reductase] hydrolase